MALEPSPNVRRRRLGAELRRLREATGLTGTQVINRVGWASPSKLSRLENGRSRPDPADISDLLDLYGVSGCQRDELLGIARDAASKRWLQAYPVMTHRQRGFAELEAGAADIREYATAIVPGLLQTAEYARVRILSVLALEEPAAGAGVDDRAGAATVDDIETEVAARMARQSLLIRRIGAPRYEAVLDESALTARGGPTEVMRAQLRHLHRLGTLPNVTLRILPHDARIAEWYLPHTAFSLYRFTDPRDPETVAVEALGVDLLRSEQIDVRQYATAFGWLRGAALSPAESMRWLASAAAGAGVPAHAGTRTGTAGGPPAVTSPRTARETDR